MRTSLSQARRALPCVLVGYVLLSGAMPGCSPPSDERLARDAARVIGGEASPGSHDAIVFTRVERGGRFSDCTGSLIAPRVLLTAKHCVTSVGPGEFVCDGSGELITDGTGAGVFGSSAEPEALAVWVGATPEGEPSARGREILASGAEDACRDDLALVVLDRDLAAPSYLKVRRASLPRAGERVTLVGYGAGEGGVPERREVHGVRVLEVGASDGVGASGAPRSFVVGGGALCSGDSGGPALSETDDELVGVYSRISGDCASSESRNTFVVAAAFSALIDAALERSGIAADGGAAGAGGSAGAAPTERGVAGAASLPTSQVLRDDALRCVVGGSPAPGAAALLAAALYALSARRRRRDACAGARCRNARGG